MQRLGCWMGVGHCLVEISRDISEKNGRQHMLLQNLYASFSINGAFTEVQVTHDAMGTNTPKYHHRLLAFELCTGNNLDGLFPL